MANTEGMPDEVVEEMLSSPSAAAAAAAVPFRRSAATGRAGGGSAAAASRAERIRRRDEAMRAQRERQQQKLAQQKNENQTPDGESDGVGGEASIDQDQQTKPDRGNSTAPDSSSSSSSYSYEQRKQIQQARMDAQPAFRLHASRAEMMDNWSEGGGMVPAATVVRSSRAPAIRGNTSTRSSKKAANQHKAKDAMDATTVRNANDVQEKQSDADPIAEKTKQHASVSFAEDEAQPPAAAAPLKPVIKAASVQERPVHLRSMAGSIEQQGNGSGKKPSKFLQRRMQQQQGKSGGKGETSCDGSASSFFVGGTAGGFPSLDVPIGTFARKKGGNNKQTPTRRQPTVATDVVPLGSQSRTTQATNTAEESKRKDADDDGGGSNNMNVANSMLAGMTQSEIMDGIAEIESALSEQSLAFLRARGRKKKQAAAAASNKPKDHSKDISSPVGSNPVSIAPTNPEGMDKAKEAEILASIKTEEDLDRVYSDFNIGGGGAAALESSAPEIEAPGGKIQDLESATALLRSTSYRQTMLAAKTACELLSERIRVMKSSGVGQCDIAAVECASAAHYPPLLPVALRCLLDLPQPHRHEPLHSYVLQSMRYLVDLFAHPSHRVSTSLGEIGRNASSAFQLHFLDDDISAPAAASCYESGASKLSAAQKVEDSPVEGALYATNSSAESARKDGEAFYADPLWTLLSRMRIIPCLARIIASAKGPGSETLPDEIVTSICSILAMLSLRSPGAACAIAQHKTILPHLVDMTLTPGAHFEQMGESKESFLVNPRAALPTLIFLCTLARQSRTIASQTEPFASIISTLHAILGIAAETVEELAVQKQCLLLWRILLRYGLAVPHLSTFISLATPHLSTKNATEFSLTADYLSAFSNVCECAKVITRSETESSIRLTEEQADTLAMAGAYLSPHVQKCSTFLQKMSPGEGNADAEGTKLVAARLRFLLSYVAASAPTDIMKLAVITEEEMMGTKLNDVDKSAFVSVVSRRDCISALKAVFKSGLVNTVLDKVLSWALVTEWTSPVLVSTGFVSYSLQEEASFCAFLTAFVSLLSNMVNNESIFDNGNSGSAEEKAEVKAIALEFASMVYVALATLSETAMRSTVSPSAARSGWIDASHYALVKFLSSVKQRSPDVSISSTGEDCTDELRWLREMAFALIGRLKVGDEAMAAVLLSQDILFATPSFGGGSNQGSPLQAMLLRELCNSPRSHSQLDHSFKLHRGHGITAAGEGPFGLESLRSDAEFVAPPSRDEDGQGREIAVEPLIPLGKVWLWQVLSSTIDPPPEASVQQRAELLHDAAAVIVSSLDLLTYMERGSSSSTYVCQIASGAKLYHLSNSCLFPEEVLRHEKFEELFCCLFQQISSGSDHQSIPKAYVTACFQHSRTNRSKVGGSGGEEEKNDEADEEKLLALFEGKQTGSEEFSTKEVAALVDFVGDMCSAYTEYGAQYKSLNHCVRLLLRYGFPPKARIEIITKLRGLLHLLTFPDETDESMAKSLEVSLASGSDEESPEVLDALANTLSFKDSNDSIRRLDVATGGYAYFFAVASLAHSYARKSRSKEPGAQAAASRRLEQLGDETKADVLRVSGAVDNEGLVHAVLGVKK